jgi:hypothetical protein
MVKPALAVLLAVGLFAGGVGAPTALGQDVQIVSGDLVELDGSRAVVATNTANVPVLLDETTRFEKEGRGTLADIQPGQYMGVTARPSSAALTALRIRVFPAAQSTIPSGQSAMSGPDAGNIMTNATVESLNNGVLTLNFSGQIVNVGVNAETEVLRQEPATSADLRVGGRVIVTGIPGDDGTLRAQVVNIR